MRLTRSEAEDFLYREAQLLDDRRLDEWLELFTQDGIYWIPLDEATDPEHEPSILHDDSALRMYRVHQLLHQPHYAQLPPSRTVHLVTNVQVHGGDHGEEATVRCNAAIAELRPGDHQRLQHGLGVERSLAGRCEYRLRYQDGEWKIALKKVLLINHDLPMHNLTFII